MGRGDIADMARELDVHSPVVSNSNLDSFWRGIGETQCPGFGVENLRGVGKLPSKVIVDVIRGAYGWGVLSANIKRWEKGVAAIDAISYDAERLLRSDDVCFANREIAQALSIRAIPGHARQGHSTFIHARAPNTCIDSVLYALEARAPDVLDGGFSADRFRANSQSVINGIVYAVEGFLEDASRDVNSLSADVATRRLVDADGNPLAGLDFFNRVDVNMLEFMRGFYFASLMDNHDDIRTKVRDRFSHEMGGGDSFVVNMRELKGHGISLPDLSDIGYKGIFKALQHMPASKNLEVLSGLGVVVPREFDWDRFDINSTDWNGIINNPDVAMRLDGKNFASQYIRSARGLGCGDDIAVFLSAFLPQTYTNLGHAETPHDPLSRMLGAFMADHIDTVEKDSGIYLPGGQDEFAGEYINRAFRRACRSGKFREKFNVRSVANDQYNLVSRPVIVDFTAASANLSGESVHSSQRWFLKSDRGTCGLSEYVKQMYLSARAMGRDVDGDSIRRGFGANLDSAMSKIPVTFKRMPLSDVLGIFRGRLSMVESPEHRERNLDRFFLDRTNGNT